MTTLTGNRVVILGILALCENALAKASARSNNNLYSAINDLVVI